MLHHARAQRIEDHIARQFKEVTVALDEDGLVAALEHMTDAAPTAVEALRIDTVELAHPLRQIGLRRLDDEVVVVRHLAPGMAHPVEAGAHVSEDFQPDAPVLVGSENILAPVTPRSDVIEAAGKLDSQRSGHAGRIGQANASIQDLTPCPRVPVSPCPRVPVPPCPRVPVSPCPRVPVSPCPRDPLSPYARHPAK